MTRTETRINLGMMHYFIYADLLTLQYGTATLRLLILMYSLNTIYRIGRINNLTSRSRENQIHVVCKSCDFSNRQLVGLSLLNIRTMNTEIALNNSPLKMFFSVVLL